MALDFGSYLLLTGGMKLLDRLLGPKLDEWSGQHGIDARIRAEERAAKIALQDRAHVDKKELLELQMILARDERNRQIFYEKCFPLVNPYELIVQNSMTMGDDGKIRLRTARVNGKEIVPCRIISSLQDDDQMYASAINVTLSSFMATFFPANSERAVVSDIGAWKKGIPADDTYINHLYTCLRQQPTMVITPTTLGDMFVIKMWSWGLDPSLEYPVGLEFGRINIADVHEQTVYEETRKLMRLAERARAGGYDMTRSFSEPLRSNIGYIMLMHEKGVGTDLARVFLHQLTMAPEIAGVVRKRNGEKIASAFCCMAGMYADTYHLLEHRTTPLLPSLLPMLPGAAAFVPQLRRHYTRLLEIFQAKESDSSLVAHVYTDVLEAFVNPRMEAPKEHSLLDDAQYYLTAHENEIARDDYKGLRERLGQSMDQIERNRQTRKPIK